MRRLGLVALGLVLVLLVAAALAIRSRLTADGIKATLEAQASAALGEPVHIGTVAVRWLPRPGLTLEQVAVGASRTLVIERLVVSTGLRPLLSRQIAEADILVEQSRLDAPRFLALLTAPAAPSSPPSSTLPLTIDAIRSIALRNVSLTSGPRTVVVNADLAYAGNRLEIQRLDARSDITQLVACGRRHRPDPTYVSAHDEGAKPESRRADRVHGAVRVAAFDDRRPAMARRPRSTSPHTWRRARDARSARRSPISRRPATSRTGRQR